MQLWANRKAVDLRLRRMAALGGLGDRPGLFHALHNTTLRA